MGSQHITTPPSQLPPLFAALLDHSKVCRPCENYLHRNPFELDARPCFMGRSALVALSVGRPTSVTLETVLHRIERMAAANFPICKKCDRAIRMGELTDSSGTEHIDCDAEPVEPFSEFLRRTR
jgi:hypothetical protein